MIMQRRIALVIVTSVVLLSSRFMFSQTSSSQASSSSQAQSSSSQAQSSSSQAQSSTDQDIDLLRKDIRSQKKQVIAANLNLSDKEAEQFWPVYDQYTAELVKINDKKYAAIKQFAQNYNTLTDDQAQSLTREALEVDESVAQLRMKYIPLFGKVISGKKTALFFQLDHRLVMLIDLQLSGAIPLVQP